MESLESRGHDVYRLHDMAHRKRYTIKIYKELKCSASVDRAMSEAL